MPIRDCQTEKLILDTAKNIFFAEGRLQATTQDIADAAGVNRTLINYYFRSKNELLSKVLKTAVKELAGDSDAILSSALPFQQKTEKFINDFLDRLIRYPYLETFISIQMIQERLKKAKSNKTFEKQPEAIKNYLKEIETEMKAGRIEGNSPAHFLINLFSLMIYPFLAKPVQMRLMNLDDNDYKKILGERKGIILKTIFPEIKYQLP